jgi:hypothetical protein
MLDNDEPSETRQFQRTSSRPELDPQRRTASAAAASLEAPVPTPNPEPGPSRRHHCAD